MRRLLFDDKNEAFRDLANTFYRKECVPHNEKWEAQGQVDRDVWYKAGRAGLLGFAMPEEHGGLGVEDFRYDAVLAEEMYRTGAVGVGFVTHNSVIGPYLRRLTTEEQKRRWLPGFTSGELISAIAMSEPGAGSDVARMRTTARQDGDHFVLNGSKTFITNGILADLVVVAAKTDPGAGHRGISLIVVEDGTPGFRRGRKLDKVGQRARDTAELFFDDVRVPVANLIGERDRGFYHLMQNLAVERMVAAVIAVAAMERALELTLAQVRDREVFGARLGAMQTTRFTMAELQTEVAAARAYVDRAIQAVVDGELTAAEAAGVKYWSTDLQFSVVDRCVQLFGGYGYINEYEIARLWRDSRVQRIYAGSNEVMKEIVGRSMRLDGDAAAG